MLKSRDTMDDKEHLTLLIILKLALDVIWYGK